jgi:RimJ/RimL family protein N-acetyltransferase
MTDQPAVAKSAAAGGTIVATHRTILRELTQDDAAFIHELVNQPSFLANIGDKGVRTIEDAKAFILDGPWRRGQPDGYGQFLVELKSDRRPIGVCGLLYRERLDVSDVGCAFMPEFWRQGYAFETATAVMEYGRSVLGVETIVGLTAEHNHASIALLGKLGMTFERMVKMTDDDPGTPLYT